MISQDVNSLEKALNETIGSLAVEGYRVIQVIPIESGHFKAEPFQLAHSGIRYKGAGGYGYGCSYTSSMMVLAELIAN